jgi:4-hydroxy-tetrahydrodipicolinate reductase
MMNDVLVVGGKGRMGSLVATTVVAQPDMRLVGLVDPAFAPGDEAPAPVYGSLAGALAQCRPDVAVEFSLPASVFANADALLAAGVATVVGATGLKDDQLAALTTRAAERGVGLVVVPNFALGAVLLMRFACEAARYYDDAEIIEMHEAGKRDAPSGTALRTARLMAAAPGSRLEAPAEDDCTPSRGLARDGVRVHSVRLPGLVAHQEVLFGGHGEVLTLRHDSISRESFMAGVMLAIRRVPQLKETVVGLENLLE